MTGLLEDRLASLLGASLEPVEIGHRLVDFMSDHRTIAAGHRYVPNVYRVYLAPRTLERFSGYQSRLEEELAAFLQERARELNCQMVGRAHVDLVADQSVRPGRMRIEADLLASDPSTQPTPGQFTQPIAVPGTNSATPAPLTLIVGQRRFVLQDARPVSIGRALDNVVVLDHRSVSRYHARICAHSTGWLLEDLGSTNGSFVNGGRVSSTYIRRGDSIRVGSVTFLVDEPSEAERAATP